MEFLSAILLFAFTSSITPGPNNVMIMASGMNFGARRSMPHYLGIVIGFPLMLILIGLGLGSLFVLYPLIHEIIKIVGIAYLLYLSWLIANATPNKIKEGQASKPFSFVQATLFQWVNPKGWIMATSAIAAYTTSDGEVFAQILLIAFIFFIIVVPCTFVWLYFGVGLKRLLSSEKRQRQFNITMALLLVLSIVSVVAEYF